MLFASVDIGVTEFLTRQPKMRAHTGAVLRDLTSYRRAVFACASKETIKRKTIHAIKTAFKTVH